MAGEESGAEREPWSKETRDFTLDALAVARENMAGGSRYAMEDVAAELKAAVKRQAERGSTNSEEGALAGFVLGFIRLSEALLSWMQAEADNKKILLADVRRRLPDYEEPDTYPHEPRWATWDGMLLDIEKAIRAGAVSDSEPVNLRQDGEG